jgi:acetolactate synthase-1/3 small subunit
MTIECTGDAGKLEAIIDLLTRFGIKELARTGATALKRAKQ